MVINMTLLKANLFNTDDPIVMLKCWLEELESIKKSRSNVSYRTVFAESLQEESGSEKIELVQLLKDLIEENEKLDSFFSSKARAGPKRIRRARGAKGPATYVDSKSPYGTAYEENLFDIKRALNRFKNINKDENVVGTVNRIISALDKKIKRVQVLTPATQGKKQKEILDEIEFEMKQLQTRAKTVDRAKKTLKDYNKYKGLYKLLNKIYSDRNYIQTGQVIDNAFTFNRNMIESLDKLFDYGPTIIASLDDIKDKRFIEKRFDGSGIPLNGKKLQNDFIDLLSGKITMPVSEGGAKEKASQA